MYRSSPSPLKTSQDLAPEQQKALAVLTAQLGRVDELYLKEPLVPSLFCETGFMAFYHRPLSKLPHGENWIWNQSNGKVTVQLPNSSYATLQKLNTRKKKNCTKPPSYKVWVCYISHSTQEPHNLTFLWCEKGASSSASPPTSSSSGSPTECSDTTSSSSGSSPEGSSTEQEPSERLYSFNSLPYAHTNNHHRAASLPAVPVTNHTFPTSQRVGSLHSSSVPVRLPSVSYQYRSPPNEQQLPPLDNLLNKRRQPASSGEASVEPNGTKFMKYSLPATLPTNRQHTDFLTGSPFSSFQGQTSLPPLQSVLAQLSGNHSHSPDDNSHSGLYTLHNGNNRQGPQRRMH